MNKKNIKYLDIKKVKSYWYKDILSEWNPDLKYIEFLKSNISTGQYLPPIVVAREKNTFYIINGHHKYYAYLTSGKKKIKCIVIEGTFKDSEPLRKAEVLLKEFDQKTEYRYQFSGYLDRWAAAGEKHNFINKYRPTYKFRIYKWLKKIKNKLRM